MSMDGETGRLWNGQFILLMVIVTMTMTAITTQMGTLPLYVASLGGSKTVSGAVVGILGIAALLCRFPIGVMLDTYGRRVLLLIGLAVLVLDFSLLNMCRTLLLLFCLRFLQGIGNGIQTTASSTMAADLIPTGRLAVGLGYFSLASVVPSALGPLLGLSVVERFGFNALFVVALTLTTIAFVLSFFLKNSAVSIKRNVRKSDARPGGGADASHETFRLLSNPNIVLPSAIVFVVFGANSGIIAFIAQFAAENGIAGAGFYFVVTASTTFLVRVCLSSLLARMRQTLLICASLALITLAFVLIANANGTGALLLAALLCGAGQASLQPTMNTLVLQGVAENQRGRVTAFFSAASDVAYGGGALLWGAVASLCGFRVMFVICGLCAASALLLYAVLRYFQKAVKVEQ